MVCARLALLLSAFLAAITVVNAHTQHTTRTRHVRRGGFSINDPTNLASCETAVISWNGTKPPYSVGVLVGKSSNAPLYHLGKSSTNSISWEVDLYPNTTVTIAVKNTQGDVAYSEKYVVGDGDTSCLSNSSWAPASKSYAKTATGEPGLPTYSNAKPRTSTSSSAGGINNNAQATTSSTHSGASQVTAGLGLLLSAAILALVA